MSEKRDLTVVSDIDRAIEAVGGDLAQLSNLDRVVNYAARYSQTHRQRIEASAAKLKIARHGGRVLIDMAERGERTTRQTAADKSSRSTRVDLDDLGVSKDRSSRWQAIARMPEEQYLERLAAVEGEGEDDSLVVQAMGGLKAQGIVEWYTPAKYINAAREVMGGIDLDPATSEIANRTVRAEAIYTAADDGLSKEWHGRIWLNPPYGKGSGLFTTKLLDEFYDGHVKQAILLLNAYGFDSGWFQPLWSFPICFTDHRVPFYSPQRESGGPANGNIFIYLGPATDSFREVFREFGPVVRAWDEAA